MHNSKRVTFLSSHLSKIISPTFILQLQGPTPTFPAPLTREPRVSSPSCDGPQLGPSPGVREEKNNMGSPTSTPSSGHRFSGQREEFPLSEFYVLAQLLLPPLRPWGCSFGREACLWQGQKRKKKPISPTFPVPLPLLRPEREGFSHGAVSVCVRGAVLWFALPWVQVGRYGRNNKKQKNQETLIVYILSFGFLPNLPAPIYFSKFSNSCSVHSVQRF